MINQVGLSNWYSCFFIRELFHWGFSFSNIFMYPSLCFTGVDLHESGRRNWLVHALFEYTLDMKLSTDNQTGRLCLLAMHQSSGNSYFWLVNL
jgi:hypothetical protein